MKRGRARAAKFFVLCTGDPSTQCTNLFLFSFSLFFSKFSKVIESYIYIYIYIYITFF
jgi:hypothetical protein